MPVIKSAKKAMKTAIRRATENEHTRRTFRNAIKQARVNPSDDSLKNAQSALMKATKHHVIHKNKASRLISRLSKKISPAS